MPFKNKGLPLHPKSRTLDGNALLAQLVEQLTLNQWVEGSSPSGVTYKDHKKWKITENQAFSVIFILSKTPEIGKI